MISKSLDSSISKTPAQALKKLQGLCKQQKLTLVALTGDEFGVTYGIQELPTFKATIYLGVK